jgi:membrane-associated phospholipid phosphatase
MTSMNLQSTQARATALQLYHPFLGPLLTALLGLALVLSTATSGLAAPSPSARLAATHVPGTIVVDWNRQLLHVLATPGVQPATVHPTRSFAILHAAIYDAVVSVTGGDPPYLFSVKAPSGARADAAAAEAGHDVLASLYPSMAASFDGELSAELAGIPGGTATQEGLKIGRLTAAFMLALRAGDGSTAAPPPLSPSTQPGAYRPTPPFVNGAAFTQWSAVTPFVLRRADQIRPAKFWAGPIWTTWNEIADNKALAHHTDLLRTARLFALLNLSFADTTIAFYDAKYHYNLWRPVTAIRDATSAGNPAVTADPSWAPLLTASDPSYPGAHSAISAAAATVLSAFFGSHDRITVTSDVLPGVTRSFTSYSAAATEAGLSRIWAGVHTRLDHTAGRLLGKKVANLVLRQARSPRFGPLSPR